MVSMVLVSVVVGLPRGMLAATSASCISVSDAIARSVVSGPCLYPVESTTLPHVRTLRTLALPVLSPAAAGPAPESHPASTPDAISNGISAIAHLILMTVPCLCR